MTYAELQNQYDNFYTKNKTSIIQELKISYSNYCSNFISFWQKCDFGGHIVVPLFVIWSIVSIAFLRNYQVAYITLSILLVVYVLWLRHWWEKLADCICDHFFSKHEYKEALLMYVRRCKSAERCNANSEEELDGIDEFYEYCERQIVQEFFAYR